MNHIEYVATLSITFYPDDFGMARDDTEDDLGYLLAEQYQQATFTWLRDDDGVTHFTIQAASRDAVQHIVAEEFDDVADSQSQPPIASIVVAVKGVDY